MENLLNVKGNCIVISGSGKICFIGTEKNCIKFVEKMDNTEMEGNFLIFGTEDAEYYDFIEYYLPLRNY